MGSYSKKSSAEWFIDQINVENAKLLAFVLVLGFIGYHGILHLRYGPDSCNWLLSSGRYKGDHEWQPYGCMLHKYSKTDARRCLRYLAFWGKYNSFAFIGDSRLEQLYEYFIGVLKTRVDIDSSYSTKDHHMPNYTYVDNKLRLSVTFIWSDDVSRTMVEQFRTWQYSDSPPSVIVASTGLQLIKNRNTTEQALEEYKRNLTQLVQPIDALAARKTQVLWKLSESVDTTKIKNDVKITNSDIDAYNRAAVEILQHSATKLWNSPRLAAAAASSSDGLSISPTALRHSAQILLNMFCNDHMNFNDGTCCAQPEPCTQLQLLTFALFLLCAVLTSIQYIWRWSQNIKQRIEGYSLVNQNAVETPSAMAALAKLGMIMAYFYLCDRTNFFMKENKYYSEWSFWLPVGYVFALGLFFTDESRSSSHSRVLNRDQTNEWKGWMQLVILVYQVTGASKVLPIYMLVRALVSSYLFLTGYGHFYYTWKTGDTGLVRYFRVIFRLNFLTVVLCLTMNRPYQFYSFIPLVSFWYTLMFVIFALPPHITPSSSHTMETKPYQYLYIAIKVIGLLTIVTVLYMSEVFFQKIFVTRPWKALFVNADDDIHQWWLDWKQDRYSMTYGIMFAAAYLAAQRHGTAGAAGAALGVAGAAGAALRAAGAAVALAAYAALTLLCADSSACDEIHSYVSFLPVVGYVALRNASAGLRARSSGLFRWFGSVTLELFASQSHIWLAADTHGVLVLVPGAPVLNLMLTSYVFVFAAHEIRKLTGVILPYAVPDDWRLVLRNFAIFLAILVPIGIHDGMF
ncbi:N-acetylneuraminate 9-O-acetyltransferase isoform X1 [Vanessa atalanta]|uniref:N-acetylneuraminate 9-O-acetyltransferase isoform X1 n=1 Tax=Vanessa atalanta TaxID=42275 RepID=UPI001FCD1524|nr:N-acetylneuraminate 9-O-acetyltransferase isoform X1 [Vanessa atalanta]